jgi:hypothetical protein
MFQKKYNIVFLTSKWEIIQKVKLSYLPRKDEYVWLNNVYHEVVNVIHSIDNNQVLIVLNPMNETPTIKKINFF